MLISSYQLKKVPSPVTRVIVSHVDGAAYDVSAKGGEVYVDFEREDQIEIPEEIIAEVVEPATVSSLQADMASVEEAAPEKVEAKADLQAADKGIIEPMSPSAGERVTLDFQNADLQYLLKYLGELKNYNVIVDQDVKGKVTLSLRDVPLDQAIEIILQTNALASVVDGNVIRFAPKSKLEKESDSELARKKAKVKLQDLVTEFITISHEEVGVAAAQIKSVLSDRGSVETNARGNLLIINDIAANIEAAKKIIKQIDKPTPQVLIEARIVEIDTNYSRDLGVQWGAGKTGTRNGDTLNAGIGLGGSYALNPPTIGYGLGAGTGTDSESTAGAALGFNFGNVSNTFSLDLKLSALESQGLSKIISRPRIITMNDKEASIQQGFSIPFETTSESGTKTEFIDANLNLTVTPNIKPDGRIHLKIKAAKNSPDYARTGAGGKPSINKKEATTEVLIKDGDTTVIGGIFTQDKARGTAGVPWLSKIPILGHLFKSSYKTDDKAELLIFITPRIIKDTP
jgi:type IV pilus assembly protein PilQ